MKKIKTVLVDDELRVLNRMKILLRNFPEINVLEQFQDPKESIDFIIKNEPDLVFLDIEMPGLNGLEVADSINKSFLETKIIFVSSYDHYSLKAIKKEAFDYLLKPVSIDELKESISRYKTKKLVNLNKRELEIVKLISEGLNSKEIGERLFISRHTVDTYRRTILEKTNSKNTAGLILFASKNNMI